METFSKKQANSRRLEKFLYLKKKNNRLMYDITNYLSMNPNSKYRDYLQTLMRNINVCGSYILLKDLGDELEYVTAHTCKNKLCSICNAERRRILRQKYIAWFDRNPVLYEDAEGVYTYGNRTTTAEPVEYDLMHLTLTVPHSTVGYKGKRIYYRQLIQDFNTMRKRPEWMQNVFGGEYGVEATENESGLHIHIHALLFVRKYQGNRNSLHRTILSLWNHQTIDASNGRSEFDAETVAAIRKGNRTLTDADIMALSPYGATLIGLENIYTLDELRQKHYASDSKEARIKAVLETVSYHFKPKMFEREDGSFDVGELAEIYQHTKGMILYRKFGVLHAEQCLNLKDTSLLEELQLAKEAEQAKTGTDNETEACAYFLTKPANLYVVGDNINLKRSAECIDLNVHSTRRALVELSNKLSINNKKQKTV